MNEQHVWDWSKIDCFLEAMGTMPTGEEECHMEKEPWGGHEMVESSMNLSVPCSFDVVGDIAFICKKTL